MYGVMVIGHSGAGKTTLVSALAAASAVLGRPVTRVNLDPAAESGEFEVDISELVSLEDVMGELGLGPNGALLYCMDFLAKNLGWLQTRLAGCTYVLLDMPGQIELYVNSGCVQQLISGLGASLSVVQLTDAALIGRVDDMVALGLSALAAMMNLEAPFLHVLSKVDLLKGRLPLNLRDLLELDLPAILEETTSSRPPLRTALAKIFDSHNRVSFQPLLPGNGYFLERLLFGIDQANGYMLAPGKGPEYAAFLQKMDKEGLFEYECELANLEAHLNEEDELHRFEADVRG
jgi:GTPase SAR1 family protein